MRNPSEPVLVNVSTVTGNHRKLGGVGMFASRYCSVSGGFGGYLRVIKAFPDILQLHVKEGELATTNENQKQSNCSQNPSRAREPPFIRRMLVCAALFLSYLSLALWGGKYLYRKRYLVGTTLILAGWSLACIGLGLLWATRFPSTWDWWL
jgi:hypothetical protein